MQTSSFPRRPFQTVVSRAQLILFSSSPLTAGVMVRSHFREVEDPGEAEKLFQPYSVTDAVRESCKSQRAREECGVKIQRRNHTTFSVGSRLARSELLITYIIGHARMVDCWAYNEFDKLRAFSDFVQVSDERLRQQPYIKVATTSFDMSMLSTQFFPLHFSVHSCYRDLDLYSAEDKSGI